MPISGRPARRRFENIGVVPGQGRAFGQPAGVQEIASTTAAQVRTAEAPIVPVVPCKIPARSVVQKLFH